MLSTPLPVLSESLSYVRCHHPQVITVPTGAQMGDDTGVDDIEHGPFISRHTFFFWSVFFTPKMPSYSVHCLYWNMPIIMNMPQCFPQSFLLVKVLGSQPVSETRHILMDVSHHWKAYFAQFHIKYDIETCRNNIHNSKYLTFQGSWSRW